MIHVKKPFLLHGVFFFNLGMFMFGDSFVTARPVNPQNLKHMSNHGARPILYTSSLQHQRKNIPLIIFTQKNV